MSSPSLSSEKTLSDRPSASPAKAVPVGGRPAGLRSFSLKQAMSETMDETAHAAVPEARAVESRRVKAKDAFTEENVAAALRQYAGSLESDHAVKVALTSHEPKVDGFVITLEVDNDFLLGRVNDSRPALLDFLERQLNNGYIALNVTLYVEPADGKEEKRLFTAKDKLDYFMEKNAAVAELKAIFNLELE